jgi:peptidoglycan/xylan/chitin deacetylase (PgdA/CDA1 family)
VAFTFDDGPSPANTDALLNMLAEQAAQATFFMVGAQVEAQPELARRVVEAGHELGNHTYGHLPPESLSRDQLRDEIERGNMAIERATGVWPQLARPPWGNDVRRFTAIAGGLGLTTVLWSIDSGDARGYSARWVARFVRRSRSGDIVLLHDGGDDRPATISGVRDGLTELTRRGFRFVTVSQLLSTGRGVVSSRQRQA